VDGQQRVPQSETELQEFFDLSIDLLCIVGFDGYFKRVNASLERTLGYPKAELFSRSVLDITHPDDVSPSREALARLGEGHDLVGFESRVICADGTVRWLEWNTRTMPERGVVFGVARDTTERRRADSELLEAQRMLEASRDELRVLADEQAALRRVATLVAREMPPDEVFAAVVREVGEVLEVDATHLGRYDADGTVVSIAQWGRYAGVPIGARFPLEGDSVSARVLRTGRPARIDSYEDMPGDIAATLRRIGIRYSIGVPVSVQGRPWGVMIATSKDAQFPAEAESRLQDFTEFVATAIANAQARSELRQLVEEQRALRRVATLVAQAPASGDLFSAVAHEVAIVLNVPGVIVTRYEADGMAVVFGDAFESELSGAEAFFGAGSRAPADPGSLAAQVLETHGMARVDDFSTLVGTVGDLACAAGFGSGCAAPIVVNGELWGKMCAFSGTGTVLPARTEERLYDFIELVATAISNYEARAELAASEARALELANEQAALRRVAELVAREATQTEVFAAIAREIAQLLGTQHIRMARYDGDCAIVVAGTGDRPEMFPVGFRAPLGGDNVTSRVLRTGRPARIDDYEQATGPIADAVRPGGLRSTVAAPIVVGGRLWGAMIVAVLSEKLLPPDTENRLEQFTELMATAIANAEARAEIERLADEQAALRRVATLVAKGAEPGQVFAAVAEEVELLLDARSATIRRLEPDGTTVIVASIGTATGIRRTLEVPITVEGSHWGSITSGTEHEEFPPDAEQRMAEFTELAATAIANAESRSALTASRARVVAASDETRRQIERDLHDGAQQRLVHTVITLKLARQALQNAADNAPALVAEALNHAERATVELRELVHGILPPVLTHSGLRAAVHALADRMPMPVEIRMTEDRMAPAVEATAYFVVAEALTNVARHSGARHATVDARVEDGFLQIRVRDDGVGGAQPDGHGFVGLGDRLAVLDGQLRVESPAGGGTLVAAGIPLRSKAPR
jgi:PAS domain S-box-containing protein